MFFVASWEHRAAHRTYTVSRHSFQLRFFFSPQMYLLTMFKVPMQIMVLGERKDEGEGSQRYSEIDFVRHLELGPLQNRSLGLKNQRIKALGLVHSSSGIPGEGLFEWETTCRTNIVWAGLRIWREANSCHFLTMGISGNASAQWTVSIYLVCPGCCGSFWRDCPLLPV